MPQPLDTLSQWLPTSDGKMRRGAGLFVGEDKFVPKPPAMPAVPAAVPAVPAVKPMKTYELGSLSEKYESKGDPGAIGYDSTGGDSYGAYQFAHDNVVKFVNSTKYAKDFKGIKPHSNQWKTKWGEIAKKDPAGFKSEQKKYVETNFFGKQMGKLKEAGLDLGWHSNTLKDVIWSTSVQHGANTSSVADAIKAAGRGASDEKIIREIYNQRIQRFRSSTPQVRASVKNRFFGKGGELEVALARLKEEGRS